MNGALLSSENMGFRTPPEFLADVRLIAPIALDPATTQDNPVDAKWWIFPPHDGLSFPWWQANGLVFCNPPYGRALGGWAKKFSVEAAEMIRRGGPDSCLLTLTPARTDTAWFQDHMLKADAVCFLRGRLTFWSQVPEEAGAVIYEGVAYLPSAWLPGAWDKKKQQWSFAPAPFPCAVCFWGQPHMVRRFEAYFGSKGVLR